MKGCLWIILGVVVLIWAFSESTSFFITLGIFAGIIIITIIVQSNKSKPVKSNSDFSKIPFTANSYYDTDYDFVEQLYDVESTNLDFYDITYIQYEDDEIIERLEDKISNFEINCKKDLIYWYEAEEKYLKRYTDKYLKKRFRRKIQEFFV